MTEGLELPFQWDDGNFISPFVSSSDDAVAALAAWMHDSPLLPPHKDALRLTDLGCGDGQALFALSANLFSLRGGSSHGDASPLQLTVVGLDLDETLVNAAQQRAGSTVVVPPHQLRCVFESVDVRHCDVDRY
ncbi:hypothetical protein DQ04_06381000, partial [Trypanosoma grayi]|uniref:hypothetical protein n=1 Tax=Trypanosoma grayi TaxID=71804 RepID=UPI0004F40422